ncbi:MAG: archaeosine biosynthesis radical SAM protein RaSEA [Candidatus Thorarchaeota archaeon]|jgi:radical SAM enzyme (TIGR01210 family)
MEMDTAMKNLQEAIQKAALDARGQSISRRRTRNQSQPSAKWVAPVRLRTGTGKALSIVLGTVGCTHARSSSGGCTMCSYLLDGTEQNPSDDQIVEQFLVAFQTLQDEPAPLSVKIYTSGSFLDLEEVSLDARNRILEHITKDKRITEVVLESRPEFVSDTSMSDVRGILGDKHIEIGIGLESWSDRTRSICINKGFDGESFKHALETAKKFNVGVRAYVLLKPPFLTEQEAISDSVGTIKEAASMWATTISVNPLNVQKYTLVERLWSRDAFRPPWLWSVIEVLKQARSQVESRIRLLCDPVAAGKRRGAHNCGSCDKEVIDAIREFSLNQDEKVFESLSCDCKAQWHHTLGHEDVSLLVHTDRTLDYLEKS